MQPFSYARADGTAGAVKQVSGDERAAFLAGGTTIIDLMKLDVMTPAAVVDVNALPLAKIEVADSGVRIGATVRNSDLAYHETIRKRYPVLSEALLSGATPQIRNMATVGGNLLQRTRCTYFRDTAWACNKRRPGSGCSALEGYNRSHAVLGTSDRCVATHPSDMCVALAALDAVVHTQGPDGGRKIPINEFHVAYGEDPARENVLKHGELITAVELPNTPFFAHSHYLKVRDRAQFEFALASAAVALEIKDGKITAARVALGGVATKPWRAVAAEKVLVGARPEESAYAAAAKAALEARPQKFNAFKIELARRTIVRALGTVGDEPMSKDQKEHAVGRPLSRVDGRLKVTGGARYAAEARVDNVLYGVLVTSTVARGKLAAIDTAAAEKAPGVVAVLTHRNMPRIPGRKEVPGTPDPAVGRPLQPLQDDVIHHNGQPIAVVIADTFERATHAAGLVRATCHEERAVTQFAAAAKDAFAPTVPKASEGGSEKKENYARGDADKALAEAAVRVEETYTLPTEHHNPMEPHATVALWDGSKLTLYEKTQGVEMTQKQVSQALGLAADDVRVISPFVGGAFGTCLRTWPHTLIAALAAKHVRRPVKLVLTRSQMFTMTGYRPHTVQTVALGATREGKLTAIRHEATGQTSTYEEYTETVATPPQVLYACPNVRTRYRLAAMNVNTPAPMRGPGEATGVYALESALDELARALKMDPVELRLRNFTDVDPKTGQPWSSNSLKECYRAAAERFGWSRRKPEPRSMRDGRLLVGYGMATATWPTHVRPATVLVRVLADGTAVVRTGSADIGPGTYTSMTQIAADALGLPVDRVRVELGDSRFPVAPIEGGSMTLASVGSAVHEAALAARDEVRKLAGAGDDFAAALKRHGKDAVEVTHTSKGKGDGEKFSARAFGAIFVEVRVDPDLGTVRVARVVGRIAAGRIVNPKTAGSQAIGGIVGGLGMALLEETVWDPRNARAVNANLADYHVPVCADVADIDVQFVEEEDRHVNPLGAKGIAELALVGVAPAVANAVYHATGKRVRDLPITLEKLL